MIFMVVAIVYELINSVTTDSKIIGGRLANDAEFKWMISLQYSQGYDRQYCGGTLITLGSVLTACHCVVFFKDKISEEPFPLDDKLMVGGSLYNAINSSLYPEQQVRRPIHFYTHPFCHSKRRGGFENDYAVLEPDTPFIKSRTLRVMKLISLQKGAAWKYLVEMVKNSRWCKALGWGATKLTPEGDYVDQSIVLKVVGVQLLSFADCHRLLSSHSKLYSAINVQAHQQVCALNGNNSDVCKGDSGGGLVCGSYVFGILSWGPNCGETNVPSMYSSIDGGWDFLVTVAFNCLSTVSPPLLTSHLLHSFFVVAVNAFLNT